MDSDIKSCLESVDWCRADYEYFRGGGFFVALQNDGRDACDNVKNKSC